MGARLSYIGGTLIPPDQSINQAINASFIADENKLYKDTTKQPLYDELPYTTYSNLTKRLIKFVQDLQKYDTDDIDSVDKENIQLITSGVKHLNNALTAIYKDERYNPILNKKWNPYDNANKALQETIANITNPSARSKQDKDVDDANQSGDQWLLYKKNKDIKTMGTSDCQFLDIESRVSKLENCIGFVTDMNNPYPDALNAVDLLESRFEHVFGSQWVSIKQHANKMMNDLKNIKYHLDLMQARYKPTEKQTRMEWEKLEDLWIMMNKWDTVVFHLINIVKRLKSLQNYHYRTCLFIQRVNKIYDQQCFIYQSLKNDEKTLQKCLQSMEENTKLFQKNAMLLDQRLSVLDARMQ